MQGWNWSGFFEYLTNPYLMEGAVTTLWLTAVSIAVGLVTGFVLAVMRLSRFKPLSLAAYGYIWLFRGTPLLVQLIVIFTGLPQIGIRLSVVASALIGLSLNEAAYLAEIIRAGIVGGPNRASNAARALGMRDHQVMRYIVIPQALRDHRATDWQFGERAPQDDFDHLGHIHGGVTASYTRTHSGTFPGPRALCGAALYYLAMTTAWDFVQRAIERRFGRAYERLAASIEQR